MLYRQYKYKFYLNMNHSIEMGGQQGAIHSHTWEMSMGIVVDEKLFVSFSEIEKCVSGLLDKYQDKYLNSVAPFNVINPTLENVCDYMFEFLQKELGKRGWTLLIMEMSETPSRVYQVSGINAQDDFTFV